MNTMGYGNQPIPLGSTSLRGSRRGDLRGGQTRRKPSASCNMTKQAEYLHGDPPSSRPFDINSFGDPIAANLLAMLVDAGLANHGETRSGEGVFYQSQAPSDAVDD